MIVLWRILFILTRICIMVVNMYLNVLSKTCKFVTVCVLPLRLLLLIIIFYVIIILKPTSKQPPYTFVYSRNANTFVTFFCAILLPESFLNPEMTIWILQTVSQASASVFSDTTPFSKVTNCTFLHCWCKKLTLFGFFIQNRFTTLSTL